MGCVCCGRGGKWAGNRRSTARSRGSCCLGADAVNRSKKPYIMIYHICLLKRIFLCVYRYTLAVGMCATPCTHRMHFIRLTIRNVESSVWHKSYGLDGCNQQW